jgi:hypothetical protein
LTPSIHPHIERLITTITTLTGHDVAIEHPASSPKDESTHRWEVTRHGGIGSRARAAEVASGENTQPGGVLL